MPGLIGFVHADRPETSARRLERMSYALEAEPRFLRELHADEEFAFGRVGLGILNPEPQPAWNADRSICLILEGEFFDTEDLWDEVKREGLSAPSAGDAGLALCLYQIHGDRFAERLNGAFAIAIRDRTARKLALVSDRLGLHPLYYAPWKGGLAFASGVRALMSLPGIRGNVDRVALAEFLTFDHALGQRTILADVQLMPQGSVLTLRRGRLHLRRYWRPTYLQTYPVRRDIEYCDELVELLRRAIRRQTRDRRVYSLMLSGGLDSRSLLAGVSEAAGGSVSAVTWGIPGCDDQRYAQESARVVGVPHRSFPLEPDWLLHLAEKAVRLTNGLGNIVNLHALALAEQFADDPPIFLKGFLGDAMFGFGLCSRHWADYDETTRVEAHLEAYRDLDVLTFDLPAHKALFTPGFRKSIGEGVVEDYRSTIQESGCTQMSDQRLYIDFTQRVPQMTILGVQVVRDRAAVRLPFADNDLLDFSLWVPPGLRFERRVMILGFIRAFPQLAQIPFTPSGLPLMSCARDILRRGTLWTQWHLRRRGLGWLAGPGRRPSQDYAGWFRSCLREWVEATLLSPRCLERGYFQPQTIQGVVQDHMSGQNHAVRIGALLSIELWHRQFLD